MLDLRVKSEDHGDLEMANIGPGSTKASTQLLSVGRDGNVSAKDEDEIVIDPVHGVHGNYKLPLYSHMPVPLLRMEIGAGRVRWHGDGCGFFLKDFIYYLRCNHEGVALLCAPPATGTNRFVRIILLFYSFCFGLGFECAMNQFIVPEAEKSTELTSEQKLGMSQLLGLFLFFLNNFLQCVFTCGCIRSCMDAKDAKKLETSGRVRGSARKGCEMCCFRCCQFFSGCFATLVFLPLGVGAFCIAVYLNAEKHDIEYAESAVMTALGWLYGWLSGLGYAFIFLLAQFLFKYQCTQKKFKQPGEEAYKKKQQLNDTLDHAADKLLDGPLDMKSIREQKEKNKESEKKVPYFA